MLLTSYNMSIFTFGSELYGYVAQDVYLNYRPLESRLTFWNWIFLSDILKGAANFIGQTCTGVARSFPDHPTQVLAVELWASGAASSALNARTTSPASSFYSLVKP